MTERAARPSRRPRRWKLATALLLAIILTAAWVGWDNARLVVTDVQVASRRLPAAFDGMRIVQLSDLHSRDFGAGNQLIVDAVREARPDLIVLTGDTVDRSTVDPAVALALVDRLRGIAPIHAVTGNHEAASPAASRLLAGLTQRGVVVHHGDASTIERKGQTIRIAGVDDPAVLDPTVRSRDEARAVLRPALQRLTTAEGGAAGGAMPFTVLLAHRPELIDEYADASMDVVLAGHAHGGQVRVPGIGGLIAPGQGFFPALTEGVHRREGTSLVISRGLGDSVAPIRVNDPPELMVLTLRRA